MRSDRRKDKLRAERCMQSVYDQIREIMEESIKLTALGIKAEPKVGCPYCGKTTPYGGNLCCQTMADACMAALHRIDVENAATAARKHAYN